MASLGEFLNFQRWGSLGRGRNAQAVVVHVVEFLRKGMVAAGRDGAAL